METHRSMCRKKTPTTHPFSPRWTNSVSVELCVQIPRVLSNNPCVFFGVEPACTSSWIALTSVIQLSPLSTVCILHTCKPPTHSCGARRQSPSGPLIMGGARSRSLKRIAPQRLRCCVPSGRCRCRLATEAVPAGQQRSLRTLETWPAPASSRRRALTWVRRQLSANRTVWPCQPTVRSFTSPSGKRTRSP